MFCFLIGSSIQIKIYATPMATLIVRRATLIKFEIKFMYCG